MKRNQGRPQSLGKIKVTMTMTETGRDAALALAQERGTTMGGLFEELLRQELRQMQNVTSVRRSS